MYNRMSVNADMVGNLPSLVYTSWGRRVSVGREQKRNARPQSKHVTRYSFSFSPPGSPYSFHYLLVPRMANIFWLFSCRLSGVVGCR